MSYKYKVVLSVFFMTVSATALAGAVNGIVAVPQAIPAISQAGLIGMAFIIGIIGARLIHKLKAHRV